MDKKQLEGVEQLGDMIEKLDNILGAAKLPMPDSFHMKQFRTMLPEISKMLKEAYEKISGSNPWED